MKLSSIRTIKIALTAILFSFFFQPALAHSNNTADTTNPENLTLIEKQLFYKDQPIKLKMASDISLIKKKLEAYNFLKKAQRMQGWNVVWSIVGGYELGAGLVSVAFGNPIAIIDVGIGVGLLGMTIRRQIEVKSYIKLGVDSFNSK